MAMTEDKFKSTLRVELDRGGKITSLQVHERTELWNDNKLIHTQDTRIELDMNAFKEIVGELYTNSLTQINELTKEKATLIDEFTKEKSTLIEGFAKEKVELNAGFAKEKVELTTGFNEAKAALIEEFTKERIELETKLTKTRATNAELDSQVKVLTSKNLKRVL